MQATRRTERLPRGGLQEMIGIFYVTLLAAGSQFKDQLRDR